MKRSRMKPWRRPDDDKVTPEVAAAVFRRDRGCVFAGHIPELRGLATTMCRDRFGGVIDPYDTSKLTLDHVHRDHATLGRRPESDPQHLIATCAWHHHEGERTSIKADSRQRIRSYLDRVAPLPSPESGGSLSAAS